MSTVITPFQGIDSFSMATFNNRISQINTGFSYISNPNLLDNWYFGNPINQRGQTEYTGGGYTIDRWRLGTDKNMALSISDDKLSIVTDTVDSYFNFDQPLEAKVFRVGATYTLSFLVDNYSNINQLYFSAGKSIFSFTDNLATMTFTVNSPISSNPYVGIQFKTNTTTSILAAKLEIGDRQTLAHQDANGNWVLNEIPDYGEQLDRCMAYAVQLEKNSGIGIVQNETTAYMIFPLSVPLKLRPGINPGIIQNYPVFAWTSKGETRITKAVLNANYNGKQALFLTITGDFSGVQSGSVITSFKFAPFISNDL